jgi:hypothetical protein
VALQKEDGTVVEKHKDIETELVNHYRNLLSEPDGTEGKQLDKSPTQFPT